MSTITISTLFNIILEAISRTEEQEKEIKVQILERRKQNCFQEDMNIYIENPKESTNCHI